MTQEADYEADDHTVGEYGQSWPTGVGGAPCEDCERFTIVRDFGEQWDGAEPRWICRPCFMGEHDDPADDACNYQDGPCGDR